MEGYVTEWSYNILFAIMGYVGVVSSFGINNVYKRYIPELHLRNDYKNIRILVYRGMIFRTILIISILIPFILYSTEIGELLGVKDFANYIKIFFT